MPALAKIRRLLPWLSLVVLLVGAYDAWVFYSRRQRTTAVEEKRAEKDAADARRTLDLLGKLKIQNFYAAPAVVERGKTIRVCYSVIGAKTLRIEPPLKDVYPALSHCVETTPQKDTSYTLVATDDAGHTATARAGVTVVTRREKDAPR